MSFGFGGDDYITDDVKLFLGKFRVNVGTRRFDLISQSYREFGNITKSVFSISAWPSVNSVMRALRLDRKENDMFFLLYSELYYRHIFDRCETELKNMWHAFQNYINLFNFLLKLPPHQFPQIPDLWLWEMVNSFISQFQYYQHWKNDAENSDYLLVFQGSEDQEKIQEVCIWMILAQSKK